MKYPIYAIPFLSALILSTCNEEETSLKTGNKLDYYIESYDFSDLGFQPQLKVTYEYDDTGRLSRYTELSYDPDAVAPVEQRHFVFSYHNEKIEGIKGYFAGADTTFVEDTYEYFPDGKVSRITEENHAAAVNSEASFAYLEKGAVKVSYVYSNGGGFDYEFDCTDGNVVSDKTTRGGQFCSDGVYTYDQHPNPFANLGYVDYLLTNFSANNKLTENVNYVACAFPSLIPESYVYEYNDNGYPVSETTFYKSGAGLKKSRKEFFYR